MCAQILYTTLSKCWHRLKGSLNVTVRSQVIYKTNTKTTGDGSVGVEQGWVTQKRDTNHKPGKPVFVRPHLSTALCVFVWISRTTRISNRESRKVLLTTRPRHDCRKSRSVWQLFVCVCVCVRKRERETEEVLCQRYPPVHHNSSSFILGESWGT